MRARRARCQIRATYLRFHLNRKSLRQFLDGISRTQTRFIYLHFSRRPFFFGPPDVGIGAPSSCTINKRLTRVTTRHEFLREERHTRRIQVSHLLPLSMPRTVDRHRPRRIDILKRTDDHTLRQSRKRDRSFQDLVKYILLLLLYYTSADARSSCDDVPPR